MFVCFFLVFPNWSHVLFFVPPHCMLVYLSASVLFTSWHRVPCLYNIFFTTSRCSPPVGLHVELGTSKKRDFFLFMDWLHCMYKSAPCIQSNTKHSRKSHPPNNKCFLGVKCVGTINVWHQRDIFLRVYCVCEWIVRPVWLVGLPVLNGDTEENPSHILTWPSGGSEWTQVLLHLHLHVFLELSSLFSELLSRPAPGFKHASQKTDRARQNASQFLWYLGNRQQCQLGRLHDCTG